MTKIQFTFTLIEEAVLRLQTRERIERSQALLLQKHGLVTIKKKYFTLDDGLFEYPFGDVGAVYLEYVDFTDKGQDIYCEIFDTRLKEFEKWSMSENNRPPSLGTEQVLPTIQHTIYMINAGLRDQLVVSNRLTGQEDFLADRYEYGDE